MTDTDDTSADANDRIVDQLLADAAEHPALANADHAVPDHGGKMVEIVWTDDDGNQSRAAVAPSAAGHDIVRQRGVERAAEAMRDQQEESRDE